jgi:hypothetical protein
MKKNIDLVAEATEILETRGASAEVYSTIYNNRPVIAVEITWGDWKHDHLFVDHILMSNGFAHIANETTEEDGSDCYSAIHYFDNTKFKAMDFDSEIRAEDLLSQLKAIVKQCPDAIVTIRQTQGTDFPPFLTIESKIEHDKNDEEGAFVNLWV